MRLPLSMIFVLACSYARAGTISTIVNVSSTATCTLGATVVHNIKCDLAYQYPPLTMKQLEVVDLTQTIGASGNRFGSFIEVDAYDNDFSNPTTASASVENTANFIAPVDLFIDYDIYFSNNGVGSISLFTAATTVTLTAGCTGGSSFRPCETIGSVFVAAGSTVSLDEKNSIAAFAQNLGLGNGEYSYSGITATLRAADGVTPIDLVASPEPSTLLLSLAAFAALSALPRATCR